MLHTHLVIKAHFQERKWNSESFNSDDFQQDTACTILWLYIYISMAFISHTMFFLYYSLTKLWLYLWLCLSVTRFAWISPKYLLYDLESGSKRTTNKHTEVSWCWFTFSCIFTALWVLCDTNDSWMLLIQYNIC